MNNKKLTLKQTIFCKAYLANGYNGTQAAITAGYPKKVPGQLLLRTSLNL